MISAQPASENCNNLLGALDAPPCREASYLAVVDAANSRVFGGGWTLQIQIGPISGMRHRKLEITPR